MAVDVAALAVSATPEVVHKTLEIPVAEFEGEYVRLMIGKLPAIQLEMDYGYARGTHLKLELEVDDETLAKRRAAYVAPVKPIPVTGYLKRYQAMVTSANTGAIFKED